MPKTLLLADDSVTIQKVVGISFANEDVRLVTVDNGDDAVARARELRPDIVLADVVMPGMSGYEVCEAIKSDPALRHVPVLLLTGTFEAFDEARAARAGADGHITKPFEAQALVDTVNARLAAGPAVAAAVPPRPAPVAPPAPRAAEPVRAPEPAAEAYDFFDAEATEPGRDGARRAATTVLLGDDLPAAGDPAAFSFESPARPPFALPERGATPIEPEATVQRSEPFDLGDPDRTTALLASDEAETQPPVEEPAAPAFAEEAATRVFEPEPAAFPAPRAQGPQRIDPFGGPADADPLFADPEPAATALEEDDLDGEDEPVASVAPEELAGESLADPVRGRDYDVSSSDLGDPLADVGASAAPPRAVPEPASAPFAEPAPVPFAPEPAAPRAPAALAPELGASLHDSLEKLAWEAFGDVAERIVREAVERIEKVAWEVVPQMAEAVIREEIRRLKGEDD